MSTEKLPHDYFKTMNYSHLKRLFDRKTDITSDFLKELYEKTEFCIYCGCVLNSDDEGLTSSRLDHIVPLAKGGKHERANVQFICAICNNKKRAYFENEYLMKYVMKDVKVETTDRFFLIAV